MNSEVLRKLNFPMVNEVILAPYIEQTPQTNSITNMTHQSPSSSILFHFGHAILSISLLWSILPLVATGRDNTWNLDQSLWLLYSDSDGAPSSMMSAAASDCATDAIAL